MLITMSTLIVLACFLLLVPGYTATYSPSSSVRHKMCLGSVTVTGLVKRDANQR